MLVPVWRVLSDGRALRATDLPNPYKPNELKVDIGRFAVQRVSAGYNGSFELRSFTGVPSWTSYKPQGYSSVSPYVVANGAQDVIDFLIESFDARQTRRYDMPDGSIMHAEVQIDDTVVMIADGADDNPAFPIWLHVYVPEVDASYQRALDAGGLPVDEPKQREGDPDRRAGVKDPAGNTWWIATQLSYSLQESPSRVRGAEFRELRLGGLEVTCGVGEGRLIVGGRSAF